MRNKFYKLFTDKEISNDDERVAVNCYYATWVTCSDEFAKSCKQDYFRFWRYCPKQTGKNYKP